MEEAGGKPKETPKPKAKKKAAAEAGKAKKGGDADGGTPAPKRQKAAEGKAAKAAGATAAHAWRCWLCTGVRVGAEPSCFWPQGCGKPPPNRQHCGAPAAQSVKCSPACLLPLQPRKRSRRSRRLSA